MTDVAVVQTSAADSAIAGAALGEQVKSQMPGGPPDAILLFASSRYCYETLLKALHEVSQPKLLVGCSSAGEFTGPVADEGSACAIALRSPDMRFTAAVATDLRADRAAAAKQLVSTFLGTRADEFRYRSALVLTDALAGYADELVEQLTLRTAGRYQFFGGGAGDDANFRRTHVFCGTHAFTNAVVALEILSTKPIGVGVSHGWLPASRPLRVTEADGMRLVSLNAAPAVDAFEEHAATTGQRFDRANPLPFFLHNVLGIDTGRGFKLRVPLAVLDDGSVACAADVPVGATVSIMAAGGSSPTDVAGQATAAALRQIAGYQPKVGLVFDCVATRLRLGRAFGQELETIGTALTPAAYAGCNTYGQIARADGQFGGFHNCTAVVCVFPD